MRLDVLRHIKLKCDYAAERVDLDLAIVFATPLVLFCRLYFQFYRWKRPLRERRLHVFRVLVASRRAPISSERVQALNLVEVEFYKIDAVQLAYRNLLELINPKPIPLAFADDFSKRLTMLLSAMAKVLGYNLEQIEVLDGGYYPQGFFDEQAEIRAVRQAFVEVLSGQRPLLVSPAAPTPTQPFSTAGSANVTWRVSIGRRYDQRIF